LPTLSEFSFLFPINIGVLSYISLAFACIVSCLGVKVVKAKDIGRLLFFVRFLITVSLLSGVYCPCFWIFFSSLDLGYFFSAGGVTDMDLFASLSLFACI